MGITAVAMDAQLGVVHSIEDILPAVVAVLSGHVHQDVGYGILAAGVGAGQTASATVVEDRESARLGFVVTASVEGENPPRAAH